MMDRGEVELILVWKEEAGYVYQCAVSGWANPRDLSSDLRNEEARRRMNWRSRDDADSIQTRESFGRA